MENSIIEGAKLIADYLGHKYIPFNDLQGFPKAGWYEVKTITPRIIKVKIPSPDSTELIEKDMDVSFISFSQAGWSRISNQKVKYICRKHEDLRFYNSVDALLPAIKKLEVEKKLDFILNKNGIEFYDGLSKIVCKPSEEKQNWTQGIFYAVVEAIKYIKHDIR